MNLRLRLALIYGLLASVALSIALVIGYGFYERAAFRNIDGVFQLLASQSAELYEQENTLVVPEIGIPITVRVFDTRGQILETVGDASAPQIDPRENLTTGVAAHGRWVSWLPQIGEEAPYRNFGLGVQNGQRFRSFTVPLENDRLYQFIAPLNDIDRALNTIKRNFSLLGLSGVLLVLLAGYLLTAPSLRPLSELATHTRNLLRSQNITLPATLRGVARESLESQQRIPSQDELSFLSNTIQSTTTFLSEERERLDIALQAAHMGWWQWDLLTDTHQWSPEFERLLGLNPGEFRGGLEDFLQHVHPEDKERVQTLIRSTTSRPATFEYRVLLSDGTVRWIESRAQSVRAASGQIVRLLGIDLDITERKEAERVSRESDARFRAVQQTTPDGFMMFESVRDARGTITDFCWLYVNPAAENIVGRKAETLVGKRLLEEMPGNLEEGLFDAYVRVVETGRPWQREFPYLHEGLDKWFRSTAVKTNDGFAVSFSDITESKTLGVEISKNEQRYRSLIQASAQLVWSTDDKGFNTEPQQSWLEFTGQRWEDEQGWGWLNAVHPEDRARVRASWTRAIETKTMYVERERLRRSDGVFRHMEVRAVPVFAQDGSVSEWIGTHTDVTERVNASEALAESEERYRTLVTASNQVIWSMSNHQASSEQLAWWCDVTGQTEAAAKNWGWLTAVHSDDRARVKITWEASLAGLKPYDIQYRIYGKDKTIRYLAVRGVPRFDHAGNLVEWIGTMNDITTRKQDELRLAEQSKTLRNQAELLALANEAIILLTPNSIISSWNEAASELYGYTEAEAIGQSSHALFNTRFVSHSQDQVTKALFGDGYWEGELQHTNKNGERLTVLSRQALRRDDNGEPLEIIEVNWDITSRKQVEMQREKLLELTQRSEREALALAEIASSFSLAKPFETNLSTVAQRVAQTVGADACAVEIFTENNTLSLSGAYGYPRGFAEALETLRHTKVELIAEQAVRQNEVVIVKNYISELAINSAYTPLYNLAKHEAWGTVVAVPLPLTQHAGGAVIVFYPKGLDPNLTDLLQLSTIVSQVALVVENASLFQEAQGKAALEERQRLARDLHDSVSQALYGISLGANSAKTALQLNSSEAKLRELARSLDYLIYMADTAMAEMKSLIFELRPESLATEGLVIALKKHLRALELRHRFGLTLELPPEPEVSLKVKEMLYRITQEAMNNVVKHAQAKQVWITLVNKDDALELTVRDDGNGFDPTQHFPGHLGLRSMRERAESVGANYSISSAKGQGTTVRVLVPLDPL